MARFSRAVPISQSFSSRRARLSALDKIIDQSLNSRCVLRSALDRPERMLVAVRVDADRRDEGSTILLKPQRPHSIHSGDASFRFSTSNGTSPNQASLLTAISPPAPEVLQRPAAQPQPASLATSPNASADHELTFEPDHPVGVSRKDMGMLKKTHGLFTRRHLISGSTSLAATGMFLGFPEISLAKAPFLNTSAPAFYRFKLGAFEATVISDGPLNFPDAGKIFTRAPDPEIRKLLADEFLSTDAVRMEQNILILNTGDKLIMFDTGILSMKPNPSLPSGRILKSMLEAGIKPEDIDAIVLTHLHIDHAGGIMSEDGKTRNFPNAQIFTTEADFNFWQSEKLIGTPAESSRNTVLKNIVPNKDRLVMIKDGQEILPGIQAIASHGHTVGHMSYMITSGGQSLCLTGDIAHHSILLRRPKMSIVFDTDPEAASASRIKMCEMLVSQKIPALIFHLPWPGIGHIAKEGGGFRFVPSPILPG